MSVGGHRHITTEKHLAELRRLSSLDWFKRGIALPKTLIRTAEIPWLGGSSTDLKHIYIDPSFRGPVRYLGQMVNASFFIPALVQHEGIEGILLVLGRDEAGKPYSYDAAHELATAAEESKAQGIIRRMQLRWDRDAYQNIYKPFLKVTVRPPWKNIPADLNLTPYRDDDPALYREIERQILRQQVAA